MLEAIMSALSHEALLPTFLALAGDSDAYVTRYRFRGSRLWLRAATVPRVREFDEGVLDVRFRVRLSPEAAMSPTELPQSWSRLVSENER